jgi:hypothetical protein
MCSQFKFARPLIPSLSANRKIEQLLSQYELEYLSHMIKVYWASIVLRDAALMSLYSVTGPLSKCNSSEWD